MIWYLDTSAFLKLVTVEEESSALRSWVTTHDTLWSSQLLQTEAYRAAVRLGIEQHVIRDALEAVSLVLPSVTTFTTAGHLTAPELRSLDALHLATALEFGDDLEGLVTYDRRMIDGARLVAVNVVSPE